MTQAHTRLALARVTLLACSLWSFSACASGGDTVAPATTGPTSTLDPKIVTSTSVTETSTSTTAAPAPTTRPRPTTTQAPVPRIKSANVASPAPGTTCVLGTSTTTVLLWTSVHAAGIRIYSTSYGDLGQFPAEAGSAEVPFECDGGSTIFSLTPVAEGGATGDRIDLEVPSYMT